MPPYTAGLLHVVLTPECAHERRQGAYCCDWQYIQHVRYLRNVCCNNMYVVGISLTLPRSVTRYRLPTLLPGETLNVAPTFVNELTCKQNVSDTLDLPACYPPQRGLRYHVRTQLTPYHCNTRNGLPTPTQ